MDPENPALTDRLRWLKPDQLEIGKTQFVLNFESEISDTLESTPEKFVMMKSDSTIRQSLARFPRSVENIVELGIYKGGSIAMYEELFSPKRLIGIDIQRERVVALDEYLERRGAQDRVRLHYGTAQGDLEAIRKIVSDDLADGRCLDVVIDDASHQYQPTKKSLSVLLPLLRSGGIYLIEDWGWAHWKPQYRRYRNREYNVDDAPLSKLVLEAVMVSSTNPEVISDVFVDRDHATFVRGWKDIPEDDFEISRYFTTDLWRFNFRHREWKRNAVRRLVGKIERRLPGH